MGVVRTAVSADVDQIIELLTAFHAESAFSHISLNEARLTRFVLESMATTSRACFVYQSNDRTLAGCCMAYSSPYFFSEEVGAWDLLVYVRPEKRGTLVAFRLIRSLLDWGRKIGVSTVWLGTAAGIASARTDEFYTRLGMERVGALYRFKFDRRPNE